MQILKHYLSPFRLFTQNNPQKQEFKQKAIEDNSKNSYSDAEE